MDYRNLLSVAMEASLKAGQAILEVYHAEERGVELKEDDSPLTLADRNAHEVIMSFLTETNIPVLSEEGAKVAYDVRSKWDKFWMVDPLDGTKEFIKRNGEFTVNIALIENGKPTLGVVYVPVTDKLYSGNVHENLASVKESDGSVRHLSHKSDRNIEWTVKPGHKAVSSSNAEASVRIVCSRSHMNDETLNFLEQFTGVEKVPMGSSLKFMVIAESDADIYPRFGPTMEWDTAAAHAVIAACGYSIKNADTYKELDYNKENLLNPYFVAF